MLSYPLYDAHGNMVMTISRSGTNNYAPAMQERSFDAWGNIRIGLNTGDPAGRYCANLGHKQDDESGLIYMRARYYDPTCGRFISEDPSRATLNFFAYARNNPVTQSDISGKSPATIAQLLNYLLANFMHLLETVGEENTPQQVIWCIKNVILRDLKVISNTATIEGADDMAEGEEQIGDAAMCGSLEEIQSKIGEIRQGLGAEEMAYGVAAKMAMKLAEIAIVILDMDF